MPALGEGKIVISDRYILSSLILQEMDGVGTEFILNTNSEIIKPDLQLAVIADEKILQERLSERDVLTRFEKENQSKRELDFMEKGVRELRKGSIATPSLVAGIMNAKYVNGMPLARQEREFARYNLNLSTKTSL